MTASLDEMYDEMLRGEFRTRGKHAAADAGPVLAEEVRAYVALSMDGADAPIHDEFEAQPPAAVAEAPAEGEGPRGLARYRNAAMVGAGGLACAAVGAFLGGLGGYFTIAPAAAHPLASSVTTDQSPADTANAANDGGATTSSTEAVVTAALTSLSGSLTQNAAPLQWLTAQSGSLPETAAATLTDLPGAGTPGTGSGCTTTTTDVGLGCVLGNLTTALGSAGALPSDPTEELSSLVPSLTGVVTDVTGTLADLGSLMPISSLPLPAGDLPALGLPAIPGVPGLGGLGGLGAVGSSGSGLPGPGDATSALLSGPGGIASLLDGVTAAATAATGSGSGSGSTSPSLPLGGSRSSVPGLPSLPVTASVGGKASTRTGSASGRASSGTTSTTPTSTTTTTTTVTVPLPSLPLPVSAPPVSVGGVSVGVSTSGSGSGLTLTLP
jgi:hypothetical protein